MEISGNTKRASTDLYTNNEAPGYEAAPHDTTPHDSISKSRCRDAIGGFHLMLLHKTTLGGQLYASKQISLNGIQLIQLKLSF